MSRIEFGPVVKMAAETRATDVLRNSIVNGSIAPGSRITEIRLADEMQLSRATVRTALHQLATEGLIFLVPYTGWTVASLSAHDVWELYTLRSSLERLAAQLLAKQLNDDSVVALKVALEKLVKECTRGNRNRIAEADFALHKTIIGQVEHGRLKSQYQVIEQQIRMYIRSSDALIQKPSVIVDQHKPIVAAILSRNEELAGRLSELHNLTEGQKLSDYLRKNAIAIPVKQKKSSNVKSKKSFA
ncbi:MAG: GntR family transcriptional regulator [Afipia sp.]|nr:GntR family transcriptional regulator [Afipia sp.]